MSNFETFLWGLGGATLGYFSIKVLPILTEKAEGKSVDVQWGWLFVQILVYILAGAFVAMMMGGATEPKHAVFYGMGWQSVVRGGGELAKGGGKAIRSVGQAAEKK